MEVKEDEDEDEDEVRVEVVAEALEEDLAFACFSRINKLSTSL